MANGNQLSSSQLTWLKAIGIEYLCLKHSSINVRKIKGKLVQTNQLCEDKETKLQVPIAETILQDMPVERKLQKNTNEENQMSSRVLADLANTLDALKEAVLNFDGCASLKKFANKTVFADGNQAADVMLIGEAPGASEDAAGIPFCGESGKLLDNLLASIGLLREKNAYITNTVFWRPPANRAPTQEELDICRPFLEKHIALIKPKLIILVGSTAATSLLGAHAGISKIRQAYYSYTNKYISAPISLTAIFHPAYLLRQPMQKKTTWYDLLKIQEFLMLGS